MINHRTNNVATRPQLGVFRDVGTFLLPIAGTVLFMPRDAMEVPLFDQPVCRDSHRKSLPSSWYFAMRATFVLQ